MSEWLGSLVFVGWFVGWSSVRMYGSILRGGILVVLVELVVVRARVGARGVQIRD